ncbi:hypothetical protein IF1G_00761 [Cordyceps javanica]|uniref:Uncharacterized protein n=1 Tax=Cordyceps javanica TaxID=43265 RepID=A0A545VGS2_9HYPO|nr:hypothetical protein IF1G_00761 [Cordyceps javanica]
MPWKTIPCLEANCNPFTVRVRAPLRATLESYIRNSATTLLLRQRRTLFPQPSESTKMDISATTLGALLGPEGMGEEPLRLEFSVYELELTPAAGRTESSSDILPSLDKLDLLTVRQGRIAMLAPDASTIAPVQAGSLFIQLKYTEKNRGVGSELGNNSE